MTAIILTLILQSSTGPVVMDAARFSTPAACAATVRRMRHAWPTVQAFCVAEDSQ